MNGILVRIYLVFYVIVSVSVGVPAGVAHCEITNSSYCKSTSVNYIGLQVPGQRERRTTTVSTQILTKGCQRLNDCCLVVVRIESGVSGNLRLK